MRICGVSLALRLAARHIVRLRERDRRKLLSRRRKEVQRGGAVFGHEGAAGVNRAVVVFGQARVVFGKVVLYCERDFAFGRLGRVAFLHAQNRPRIPVVAVLLHAPRNARLYGNRVGKLRLALRERFELVRVVGDGKASLLLIARLAVGANGRRVSASAAA